MVAVTVTVPPPGGHLGGEGERAHDVHCVAWASAEGHRRRRGEPRPVDGHRRPGDPRGGCDRRHRRGGGDGECLAGRSSCRCRPRRSSCSASVAPRRLLGAACTRPISVPDVLDAQRLPFVSNETPHVEGPMVVAGATLPPELSPPPRTSRGPCRRQLVTRDCPLCRRQCCGVSRGGLCAEERLFGFGDPLVLSLVGEYSTRLATSNVVGYPQVAGASTAIPEGSVRLGGVVVSLEMVTVGVWEPPAASCAAVYSTNSRRRTP